MPGDWRDPSGWMASVLADIEREAWTVVVLHDVPDASLAGLDEFLVRCADAGVELTLDVPDELHPDPGGRADGLVRPARGRAGGAGRALTAARRQRRPMVRARWPTASV